METTLTRRLAVGAAMLGATALLMTLVAATTAPPADALECGKGCKKQIQKCKNKYSGKAEKKCIKKVKQKVPAAPVGTKPTSLTLYCTDCGPGNTHARSTVHVAGDITPRVAAAFKPISVESFEPGSPRGPKTAEDLTGHYEFEVFVSSIGPSVIVPVTATYAGSSQYAPSTATINIQIL